jgi:hypothetical protein
MGERANGFVAGRAAADPSERLPGRTTSVTARQRDQPRRRAATGLLAATGLGLILGVIGPFGSYLNAALPVRIAYWVVCLWSGWLTFGVSLPILMRWARARRLPWLLWAPPAAGLLAIPPTVVSRQLAVAMWPVVGRVSWLEWYAQCLVISALATFVTLLAVRPRGVVAGPPPLSADPRDRLPARLGRNVLCLRMEDHYVRMHTPLGSALVLMSLSQAIAGMRDIEGMQTHRSWWVARTAIVGVIEDGRKLRLQLAGGLEAPVSRARVGLLRERGWLGVPPGL